MKNEKRLRELLGINQKDLAVLLQVSRSQLAMYESGKRGLPTQATKKLALLLTYLKKDSATNDNSVNKIGGKEEKSFLEKLLLKNKYQQLITEKNIKVVEKKQRKLTHSKAIINELIKEEISFNQKEMLVLKSIGSKTDDNTLSKLAISLLHLQLKKEVLAYEKKLLLKKLKSI